MAAPTSGLRRRQRVRARYNPPRHVVVSRKVPAHQLRQFGRLSGEDRSGGPVSTRRIHTGDRQRERPVGRRVGWARDRRRRRRVPLERPGPGGDGRLHHPVVRRPRCASAASPRPTRSPTSTPWAVGRCSRSTSAASPPPTSRRASSARSSPAPPARAPMPAARSSAGTRCATRSSSSDSRSSAWPIRRGSSPTPRRAPATCCCLRSRSAPARRSTPSRRERSTPRRLEPVMLEMERLNARASEIAVARAPAPRPTSPASASSVTRSAWRAPRGSAIEIEFATLAVHDALPRARSSSASPPDPPRPIAPTPPALRSSPVDRCRSSKTTCCSTRRPPAGS